ncbi:hypothetical protein BD626DRAFT_527278 [Schizophyllum amplum]|uniref:Uncharacterized protein n=1 Tax=Schizophyllum amplum TaxID=97359 RepID=A0A550BS88_9AGAR|nr:hypothetical protein BD626DRAFT_527278 [Auriculariopsis ampla]
MRYCRRGRGGVRTKVLCHWPIMVAGWLAALQDSRLPCCVKQQRGMYKVACYPRPSGSCWSECGYPYTTDPSDSSAMVGARVILQTPSLSTDLCSAAASQSACLLLLWGVGICGAARR